MKTDQFEKTIRQKLESISPDFQESDWAKMQNYMHVQTPPTFWQQYGSWLGYAAAASVTTVMAFMYLNQLSQNNKLSRDVKFLQKEIAVIREKPAASPKIDTVYILRDGALSPFEDLSSRSKNVDPDEPNTSPTADLIRENAREHTIDTPANETEINTVQKTNKSPHRTDDQFGVSRPNDIPAVASGDLHSKVDLSSKEAISSIAANVDKSKSEVTIEKNGVGPIPSIESSGLNSVVVASPATAQNASLNPKALDARFEGIVSKTPKSPDYPASKMNGVLLNRLSAKQIRKTWLASTAGNYKNLPSDKKSQQTTQAENVIPRLNIKAPYRFGGGMEWQKGMQVKTVTGEVLVAKKFSISAGLSWLKVKPMEFFTEKKFREKTKQGFPNEVPKAFVVTNIRVEPTLMQIPLTVAFRNELKDNFVYFVGAGTNITVKSNERISYTCLVTNPRQEFLSQSFDRKMDISPINSINFSLGLEKTWHPIVVQTEGYVYSYFKPLNPLTPRSGPGFKVKLLYQIGMKR